YRAHHGPGQGPATARRQPGQDAHPVPTVTLENTRRMANTTLAISRAAPLQRGSDFWLALKRSRAAYLLMFPFLLHFLVVVAYPFAYSVYLSFFDASLNRTPVFVGLGNFVRLA